MKDLRTFDLKSGLYAKNSFVGDVQASEIEDLDQYAEISVVIFFVFVLHLLPVKTTAL